MKRIKMPAELPGYTIWAIWGVLVFGSAIWLVIGSLKTWGSLDGSAAAWVQAFGSMIAIVAAGAFPLWHEAVRSKSEARRLGQLLAAASYDHLMLIFLLYWALDKSIEDFGERSIKLYVDNGHHLKWGINVESLKAFPRTQLNAHQFKSLNALLVGAEYAKAMSDNIDAWEFGYGAIQPLRILKHHLEMAQLIHNQLKHSAQK